MSPSGDVITRLVEPEPGPVVEVCTRLAANRRSLTFVVVAAALVLDALLPVLAETTSTGILGSAPLYSRIRMSGYAAAPLNVTVSTLDPAAAALICFAK
jgi:hypothetical protein